MGFLKHMVSGIIGPSAARSLLGRISYVHKLRATSQVNDVDDAYEVIDDLGND